MNVDIPVSKKTMTAPPAQYVSKGTELEEEQSLWITLSVVVTR